MHKQYKWKRLNNNNNNNNHSSNNNYNDNHNTIWTLWAQRELLWLVAQRRCPHESVSVDVLVMVLCGVCVSVELVWTCAYGYISYFMLKDWLWYFFRILVWFWLSGSSSSWLCHTFSALTWRWSSLGFAFPIPPLSGSVQWFRSSKSDWFYLLIEYRKA